jgi:hypothetical protein
MPPVQGKDSCANVIVTVTKPVIRGTPDDDRPPRSRIAFSVNVKGDHQELMDDSSKTREKDWCGQGIGE